MTDDYQLQPKQPILDQPEHTYFDPNGEDVIHREEIPHELPATERSVGRRIALQMLYEMDSTHHQLGSILTNPQLFEHDIQRQSRAYAERLARGIAEHIILLDSVIQIHAPEWPIDQVSAIDRNVIRIGLYELVFEPQHSIAMVIDEAVILAHVFGAEHTPRFVNGVLGAIADDLESVRHALNPDYNPEDFRD